MLLLDLIVDFFAEAAAISVQVVLLTLILHTYVFKIYLGQFIHFTDLVSRQGIFVTQTASFPPVEFVS